MAVLQSAFGLAMLLTLACLASENRKALARAGTARMVAAGLGLQVGVALLLLKVPASADLFMGLNALVSVLENATRAGTSFVFGYLGGGPLPFEEPRPGAAFVLAFQALPLILVVSALSSLLFYWRVLPWVVRGFSFVLRRSMGIGGALGVSVAANVFVGMIEAPLLVRPYVLRMTRSELFTLMTSGMATIAGTVLVLYGSILKAAVPGALGHILTASLISAPAAVLVSRLLVPESEERQATEGGLIPAQEASSSMDAITRGTASGVTLLIHVVAMLIVLVALVALLNGLLGLLPAVAGEPLTLQRLLGWVMAPVVWLIGVPWSEAGTAGMLMGTKTVLNELLAYLEMAALPTDALSERTRVVMTYAMCGFANLGSLGIMIGGLGAMAPERRDEVVALGLKSIVAGTLATLMTGAVVGMLL
jgi:CNT family concentrative nucleoside transporter